MRIFITSMVCATLAGCAAPRENTADIASSAIQAWQGKHVDRLVTKLGPPARESKLTDGRRVMQWVIDPGGRQAGMPVFVPDTTTVHGPGGRTYTGHGTKSVQMPGRQIPDCVFTFTIGLDQKVQGGSHKGCA